MSLTFDTWRAQYDTLTFRQHQDYNQELARQYPHQRSWNAHHCADFIDMVSPSKVVELGGWDGGLAAAMLEQFSFIREWVNYDITPDVPQVCDDPRYHKVALIDWPWNCHITGDALVASHVFEHMRMAEVEKIVRTWDVHDIYADVPIGSPTNWAGYQGTHILEVGDEEFLDRMAECGFYGSLQRTGETVIYSLHRT